MSITGNMDSIRGASGLLSERGYILDVRCGTDNVEEERRLLESLYEKGVGGIILYPITDRKNLELMNRLYLDEYPIVSVDKYFESVPISYVVSDNQTGEYEAARHMIELGHKNIAFISDEKIEDATSVRNRYFGYCRALKENGIAVRLEFVKNGDFYMLRKEESLPLFSQLLKSGVTAFCCINDYVAAFALKCLLELGFNVPRDVSVAGFDNLALCDLMYVSLTTVEQDMELMGRDAAQFIVDSIEHRKYTYMQRVQPVKLVRRSSCRPPQSAVLGID